MFCDIAGGSVFGSHLFQQVLKAVKVYARIEVGYIGTDNFLTKLGSSTMQRTPQGNEVLDFDPRNLPHDYLAAIGLMSASASSTDSIVEMAVAGMLGIDGEQGWAVTAHMPAPL